ncbi:uncharacterized protein GGS25DRAFT_507243 [Hypoxylon fragiforme]|uniref:uncharacterized protein n=1 Tax=Hypoxylon fragiforme TaxID=63214 RepID=UPI0020C60E56|nr:uncharacterized protein GGS25DRAFT_507243 [Hypoxylon fragiforme]KAI2604165.1 hypothetical protein GGS25DRAFT_507243 [Hypoxylon fragiforme]
MTMAFKAAIFFLGVAALFPSLYDAGQRLALMYANSPGQFVKINNFKSYEIKFADTFRNCEDGLLIESAGIAILSCDPGREMYNTVIGIFRPGDVPGAELYAYDYTRPDAPESETLRRIEILNYDGGADFHTLGVVFDEATNTLFAANHRKSGTTIEMFSLDLEEAKATHFRTIRHPLLHGPNSVTLINSNELLVTNDHHFPIAYSRVLATAETYLSLPIGTVVHVDVSELVKDPTAAVEASVVARVPFANGIEFLNSTTLAVASTSKTSVYL